MGWDIATEHSQRIAIWGDVKPHCWTKERYRSTTNRTTPLRSSILRIKRMVRFSYFQSLSFTRILHTSYPRLGYMKC